MAKQLLEKQLVHPLPNSFFSDQNPQQYLEYIATPGFTTHNLQFKYNTPWKTQMTIRVNNLFAQKPQTITNTQNKLPTTANFTTTSAASFMHATRRLFNLET